jgi:hypothetical protein
LGNAINTLTGDDAVDLATRYGDGKTTEAENNRIEFSLAIYTAPVPVYDKELNKDVLSPGNELPNLWKNAKNKRTGNVDTPSNVELEPFQPTSANLQLARTKVSRTKVTLTQTKETLKLKALLTIL